MASNESYALAEHIRAISKRRFFIQQQPNAGKVTTKKNSYWNVAKTMFEQYKEMLNNNNK